MNQEEQEFEEFGAGSGYEGGLTDSQYYNATVTAMTQRMITGIQFPGMKVIWTFSIDGSGEPVEGMTSTATGENSKAADWLTALFGTKRFEARATQPIKRDEIVGKECMVLIKFSEKGWPRVQAVLPRQQVAQPAPVAPTPVSAPVSAAQQRAEDFDDLPF